MATIYERKNKSGSVSYRVDIRRKGLKRFNISFAFREEAEAFVKIFEPRYVLGKASIDRLRHKREQEFTRKGAHDPN